MSSGLNWDVRIEQEIMVLKSRVDELEKLNNVAEPDLNAVLHEVAEFTEYLEKEIQTYRDIMNKPINQYIPCIDNLIAKYQMMALMVVLENFKNKLCNFI